MPTKKPGHNLLKKKWATLNRIRTIQSRYGYLMHKSNIVPTPNCNCGYPYQKIPHILNECPIRKFNSEPEDTFNEPSKAIEWINKSRHLNQTTDNHQKKPNFLLNAPYYSKILYLYIQSYAVWEARGFVPRVQNLTS